jgi:glutamate racemase
MLAPFRFWKGFDAVNARPPRVLMFDSGLGGLTVFAPLVGLRPDLDIVYLADDAAFPYGRWADDALIARIEDVIGAALAAFSPDLVVIACNTATTIALGRLRESFPSTPFVGTVPAIKPAAAASQSKRISVLATEATVAREYTRKLIAAHAGDCEVTLVGAGGLARQAERHMRGLAVDGDIVAGEIAPAFVEVEGIRTDQIVLACTHFPLLLDVLKAQAPWGVAFVDPGEAIARRVDALLTRPGTTAPGRRNVALTSTAALERPLQRHLASLGFMAEIARLACAAPVRLHGVLAQSI